MNRILLWGALGAATFIAVQASALAHDTVAGAIKIEAPWLRATAGGAKVAAGYAHITNTGAEPDRLLGGSLPIAAKGEVHEMSMEGGVMKMRPLEGGLPIGPGQTVELKPGGLHVMFMGLTGGLKEGEGVKGTLVFEKAGTVEVLFQVGGIGAQTSPQHGH